jgi:hypothetical protein
MGAWGVTIFSDDVAADVRGDFRELIGDGHTPDGATKRLIKQYREILSDPDEAPVFWLSLAAVQWQIGCLTEKVKLRAIKIIDSGKDLKRWEGEPALLKKRAATLAELREQLLSVPPPPKRIPRTYRAENDWKVGEVVAYRLQSGRKVLLRVIGHHTDKGGTSPVCELLDWVGTTVPEAGQVKSLPIKKSKQAWGVCSQFMLGMPRGPRARKAEAERIIRLGVEAKPRQKPDWCVAFPWEYLDSLFQEVFGIT